MTYADNCHSQTDTFAGKNQGKNTPIKQLEKRNQINENKICQCGNYKNYLSSICIDCEHMRKLNICIGSKIDWPNDDILIEMLNASNFVQLGKQLGVSDNAIRKHMKKRGLI